MSSMFNQYRCELDSLRFSDDAMVRMTERLRGASADKPADTFTATGVDATPQPSRPVEKTVRQPALTAKHPVHRVLRIAASVAIAVGIGLGATSTYAAVTQRSLSAVFSDIFGGAPAQTEIIEKIGHPIGATATSNGVTVTADAVIGSQTSCTMVFSIARDDGNPLGNLVPAADSTLPLLWMASDIQIDGIQGIGGGGYFYDADPADSSVQYVYTINNATAPDGGGLAGHTARVHLSDLSLASDRSAETEAIAKGSWDLKFQLAYQDSSIALQAGQHLELDGTGIIVDKLSVSSVGASVTYTVNTARADSGAVEAIASRKFTRLLFAVTFKDGRTKDGTDADAFTSEQNGTMTVTKSFAFDTITDVDGIAYVTVGDQAIPAR